MTLTTPFTVTRKGYALDCEVSGTVVGSRGQIDEVYDIEVKCLCGHVIEIAYDDADMDRAEAVLIEAAQEEAAAWREDYAISRAGG